MDTSRVSMSRTHGSRTADNARPRTLRGEERRRAVDPSSADGLAAAPSDRQRADLRSEAPAAAEEDWGSCREASSVLAAAAAAVLGGATADGWADIVERKEKRETRRVGW